MIGAQSTSQFVTTIVIIMVALGLAALWALALADLARRREDQFAASLAGANTRLLWLLVVLFFSAAGAVPYYFLVMRRMPLRRG